MESDDMKSGLQMVKVPSDSQDEEESLVPRKRRVSLKTAVKLRTAVIVVSIISIVVLLILGAVTLAGAIIDRSSAAFAFALDAFLDSLSSVVVLWRYTGNGGNLYSPRRECTACLILGFFFILSAIIIMIKSIYGIVKFVVPTSSLFLWWGAVVNLVVCGCLVTTKIYLAYKLESRSLLTDAFNTIAGAILALSTIISVLVYQNNHNIWQIDGVTGIVCSIALFLYGVWISYDSGSNLRSEKKAAEKAKSIGLH